MKTLTHILLALATALLITACGGRKEVRITEGTETIGALPRGTLFATNDASIVHVNLSGRMATIRNGKRFTGGAFLIVKDAEGNQTGVLKALPKRESGLRIADVLEGEPKINNIVTPASPSEATQLAKIYRDPEED